MKSRELLGNCSINRVVCISFLRVPFQMRFEKLFIEHTQIGYRGGSSLDRPDPSIPYMLCRDDHYLWQPPSESMFSRFGAWLPTYARVRSPTFNVFTVGRCSAINACSRSWLECLRQVVWACFGLMKFLPLIICFFRNLYPVLYTLNFTICDFFCICHGLN